MERESGVVTERVPPEATLYIGSWSSTCGACGLGANPRETHHTMQLGYGEHDPDGCGALFTAVMSEYDGSTEAQAAVAAMRPDLPYLGVGSRPWGMPHARSALSQQARPQDPLR